MSVTLLTPYQPLYSNTSHGSYPRMALVKIIQCYDVATIGTVFVRVVTVCVCVQTCTTLHTEQTHVNTFIHVA